MTDTVVAPLARPKKRKIYRHAIVVRITHWINVVAMLIMIFSGWRIYNASPLFSFKFPVDLTLGGWLGGALQWHFAAMWVLALNGLAYLLYGIFGGHFKANFLPLTPRAIWNEFAKALRGKIAHEAGVFGAGSASCGRQHPNFSHWLAHWPLTCACSA